MHMHIPADWQKARLNMTKIIRPEYYDQHITASSSFKLGVVHSAYTLQRRDGSIYTAQCHLET